MHMEPPRTAAQRRSDTERRLGTDDDCWVATADGDGNAYLVPLSFHWDGADLIIAIPASSPTARNLLRNRTVRVGVGPTRDVVLIEGTGAPVTAEEFDKVADAYVAQAGWDPRRESGYQYFRISVRRLQAWREVNELRGRDLVRDGEWLVT